eukprot:TRINITY_DN624_c0_g2_i1.p1 TRINITY_DN624_c0_g2~~TRINITY_DN624_c0_g2_i1.p1  ORF type:complete len:751 (-),score=113.70 TRINITY_DN624_c0_g2_i1:36-2288(-)
MGGEITGTSVYNLGKAGVERESMDKGALALPVGIASLAFGPGGIGVGAYSVRQLLQVAQREEEDESASSLSGVAEVVEQNCKEIRRVLTQLMHLTSTRANGKSKRSRSILREEFEEQRSVLAEMELERPQEIVMRLIDQHCPCFHVLSCGTVPLLKDAEDLKAMALYAVSRLASAINKLPQGDPKRYPLVVMHVFATRARVDARDMLLLHSSTSEDDRPSATLFRRKLLRDAMDMVLTEAQAMTLSSTHTPYSMGILCAPALAHYSLLHKALTIALENEGQRQPFVLRPDGSPLFAQGNESIVWDDGMHSLRGLSLVSKDGEEGEAEDMLEIVTVSDVVWFLEWRELLAETSLGRIPRQIPVSVLLTSLGIPEGMCIRRGSQSLDVIKDLVLPKFRHDAEQKLGKALQGLGVEVNFSVSESLKAWSNVDEVLQRQRGLTWRGDVNSEHGMGVQKDDTCQKYERCTMSGHKKGVNALAVAPDGTLFSASQDCMIKQWENGHCVATLDGHVKFVYGLAFGPQGTLFSGSQDGTIKEWRDRRCIATLNASSGIFSLAMGEDGSLYAGLKNGNIEQWSNGHCVATLKGHVGAVRALAIGREGTLFSGSHDKTVKEWRDGCCIATIEENCMVYALAVEEEEGRLITGSEGPRINQWQDGRCVASFQTGLSWVLALALAPDRTLFSGGEKVIKQWDNGKCVATLRGHASNVWSLAVGDDGTVFSGGEDGTIIKWSARSSSAIARQNVLARQASLHV